MASAAVLIAASAAIVGVTSARVSSSVKPQLDSFHAGTARLNTPVNSGCALANAGPGSTATCTLAVTYTGMATGYLGLDVLIATVAGSGGSPLYTPSDSSDDLQITVKDAQASPITYVKPSPATNFGSSIACPSAYPGYTCYQLTDLLVNTTPFASGASVTFTTTLTMPASTNTYEGGAAYITLVAHATQSANQPSVSGCTAGTPCIPVGFKWS